MKDEEILIPHEVVGFRIPARDAERVRKVFNEFLEVARIPVRQVNEEGEELIPFEEIFPDHHAGKTVRGLRLREEMTQAELAQKIRVRQHHISEIENGKRSISIDMAKKLAKALGTEYKVFL